MKALSLSIAVAVLIIFVLTGIFACTEPGDKGTVLAIKCFIGMVIDIGIIIYLCLSM